MTITPTAPALGPAPVAAPLGDAGTTVPGNFLALVQKALAEALGGTPAGTVEATTSTAEAGTAGPLATPAAGDTQTDPTPAAGTDPAAAASAAAAAAAAGLTALVVPAVPVMQATAAGATPGPVGAVDAPAGTDAPKVAGAPAAAASSEPAAKTTGAAAQQRTGSPVPADSTTGSAMVASRPATAGAGHADTRSSDFGPGAAPQSTAPTATAVAAVPITGTTAGAPTVSASAATPTPPVSSQVFPEVTSLVSRGEGVHRITLSLKPEALGEVRVVMTVRDGAVHVRLAAGHEAQQALLEGSPELSRLLEHAGATDTRIVVRDLFAAAAPTAGSSSTSTGGAGHGTDLGQGQGLDAGSGRSQDQHAGTRAEHHATDGPTTGGATTPRSAQSATRTRTSGVDVTM